MAEIPDGVAILRARTPEDMEECFRLRYEAYVVDNSYEPKNSCGPERDEADEEGRTVMALATLQEKPLATFRYVKPLGGNPNTLPIYRGAWNFRVLQGERLVEYSRFACPRRLSKLLSLRTQTWVRVELFRFLLNIAEREGFSYGLMLIDWWDYTLIY